ncbi:MAG: hypothetical protein DCC75_08900 [Proteobacteria bacterium]|nr:MAG: hypothetical protein DCC75_08900 [Pseudomonadota bacterium]
MYQPISNILQANEHLTLILNNGFEERAARGAQVVSTLGLRPRQVVLLKYQGKEHNRNHAVVSQIGRSIVGTPSRYHEIEARDLTALDAILGTLDPDTDRVVCDITGLSRYLMLRILSQTHNKRLKLSLIYTEAKEYYPRKTDFLPLLKLRDVSEAFEKLTEYEEAHIVYSSNCDVEEIPELPGRIFPNHPVILFAFLAFKRSRLSCILNQFETNARILIESVPVRQDLKWRQKAIEIINFDLIEENKNNLVQLTTFDWKKTSDLLAEMYYKDDIGFRYNVLLGPLGSKMQTVGAWHFAIQHPDIKVITSTPLQHFPGKYSIGYADTHLVPMDSIYALRQEGLIVEQAII